MVSDSKERLSILISKELYQDLKELSQENGRSLSGYVRQILKRYIRHVSEQGPDGWWTVGK